ncbi:DUF397 domain-containing protein [Streptomyces sp. PT12]|uniref:DUF397 domain-containing protein n=1 Tax=Streptomyces sp. PT12 TaxID=1510197 RepID=UPI000DE37E72|nr:DUF397 domain-containing protein [Streptomyces sp. PT12]RBM19073.1 DUF397 domain-containing protein [Streptomyces sp. PT12]
MNRVDVTGAVWIKSSRSADNGNCVEVARVTDVVAMRDSKFGEESPVLAVPTAQWSAFLRTL